MTCLTARNGKLKVTRLEVMRAKERVRDDMLKVQAGDLSTRDELLSLLREGMQIRDSASKNKAGKDSSDLRGGSTKEVDSSFVADKDT